MKRKNKKIVAFFLSLVMVASSLTTLAADATKTTRLRIYGTDFTVGGNPIVQNNYSQMVPVGETVSVTATGDNFVGWLNTNDNKIVSTESVCEIPVNGITTYTTVYHNAADGDDNEDNNTAYVQYVNSNMQIMQAETYGVSAEAIVVPEVPYVPNTTNEKWQYTVEEIVAMIKAGNTNITVNPLYEALGTPYEITLVVDGKAQEPDIGYSNAWYYANAPIIEGKTFAYWSNRAEGGDILSYNYTYKVKASTDKTIYAIYKTSAEEAKATVGLTAVSIGPDREDGAGNITLELGYELPAGCSLVDFGVLRATTAKGGESGNLKYDKVGENGVKSYSSEDQSGYGSYIQYTGDRELVIYFRAYMLYKDAAGTQHTVEGNLIWAYSYNGWVEYLENQTPEVPDQPAVGTQANPEVITEVDTQYAATITDGAYYYSYTATEAGTIAVETYTEGATYAITNKTAGSDVVTDDAVAVNVGDVVEIVINGAVGTVDWYLMFTALPGTEANPIWLDFPTTVTDAIAPGASVYYQGRLGGMILTINDADACVSYNGTTYAADSNGVVSIAFPAGGGFFAPADVIQVVNAGKVAEAYTITLAYPAGHMENPEVIELGDHKATIAAGSQGYYYTYTAEKDGTLEIKMKDASWTYTIHNMTTYAYGEAQWSDSDPVVNPAKIQVSAGDEIQIIVNTYDATNPWEAPEGEINWSIDYAEGLGTEEDSDDDMGGIF